jgi:hypothetical protein
VTESFVYLAQNDATTEHTNSKILPKLVNLSPTKHSPPSMIDIANVINTSSQPQLKNTGPIAAEHTAKESSQIASNKFRTVNNGLVT